MKKCRDEQGLGRRKIYEFNMEPLKRIYLNKKKRGGGRSNKSNEGPDGSTTAMSSTHMRWAI